MKRRVLMMAVCGVLLSGRIFAEEKVLCDFEGDAKTEIGKFDMQKQCAGKLELAPGKVGKSALKVTFLPSTSPEVANRCVGIFIKKNPELDPRKWVENGYKVLKFWVKEDGSENIIRVTASLFDAKQNYKEVLTCTMAEVSLEDPEWKQIVIPLEDKYENLSKINEFYIVSRPAPEGYSFTIDHITAEYSSEIGANGMSTEGRKGSLLPCTGGEKLAIEVSASVQKLLIIAWDTAPASMLRLI